MTNEEFQRLVLKKLDNIDGRLENVDNRLDNIDGRLENVDNRLENVDVRLENVDVRLENVDVRLENIEIKVDGLDKKLDSVYQQTFELTEFRTVVLGKLDQIMEDQTSIFEVLGSHEITIRTLRRRAI